MPAKTEIVRRAVPPARVKLAGGDVLLSIDEVALELDVSVGYVYRLVRASTLTVEYVERFPRRPYVRLSAVHAYKTRRDAWCALHGQTRE